MSASIAERLRWSVPNRGLLCSSTTSRFRSPSSASLPDHFEIPRPSSTHTNVNVSAAAAAAAVEKIRIDISDDRKLCVNGHTVLSHVPENVSITQCTGAYGAFLGALAPESKSRHILQLGLFKELRFMCLFRYAIWWLTQRMGSSGRDVPTETHFLLVEIPNSDTKQSRNGSKYEVPNLRNGTWSESDERNMLYAVFLPLLEGSFRACLQGNEENDHLELCLESGDVSVKGTGGLHSIFLHSGTNPFQIITEAVQAVEGHLLTFRSRDKKQMPGILDWFGWGTWDAFYLDVSADGVKQGLKSFEEGGTPVKFVVVDDGWQSIVTEEENVPGKKNARRLISIKESTRFHDNSGREDEPSSLGLKDFVTEIREKHGLKYVYFWHAMSAYWGGMKPDYADMAKYDPSIQYPIHSEGVLKNHPSIGYDHLTINGMGLPHPSKVFEFFDDLHKYLADAGVDGVKVDIQNIIETLATGFGGRVSFVRLYQRALEDSIARNFPDTNGCISCMSHSNDILYNSLKSGIIRASDDFYPRDPASHKFHIACISYNTIFLGEFMQPDWDVFQSVHPMAEFHAAARSIGGCPVYVSDKPGHHNFLLLKKLALPDGSVLRAQLPGRPTRDCLFTDPNVDGKSLLKIWNWNKYTGVIGVFNCQGAGFCRVAKAILAHDPDPKAVSGIVYAKDVETLRSNAILALVVDWDGTCAFYSHKRGELVCVPWTAGVDITLDALDYEIYTISPVKRFDCGLAFAPIGLLEMFNSGAALMEVEYPPEQLPSGSSTVCIKMQIHGCGMFGSYASQVPKGCRINGDLTNYTYDDKSCLLKVCLPQNIALNHVMELKF